MYYICGDHIPLIQLNGVLELHGADSLCCWRSGIRTVLNMLAILDPAVLALTTRCFRLFTARISLWPAKKNLEPELVLPWGSFTEACFSRKLDTGFPSPDAPCMAHFAHLVVVEAKSVGGEGL